MDKVKRFDEELKRIYQESFFYGKMSSYFFFGLGIMLMMIPFEVDDLFRAIFLQGMLMGTSGVMQYMQPYLLVTENNKRMSIYKKLSFMPVTRAEIRKVRYGYLNRICLKVGTAMFAVQQAASLLNKSFGLASILFAAACVAVMWGSGILYIYKA